MSGTTGTAWTLPKKPAQAFALPLGQQTGALCECDRKSRMATTDIVQLCSTVTSVGIDATDCYPVTVVLAAQQKLLYKDMFCYVVPSLLQLLIAVTSA
ncbi:hypothetical protein MTO96_002263 [Rhipicephalus appendiculatus]